MLNGCKRASMALAVKYGVHSEDAKATRLQSRIKGKKKSSPITLPNRAKKTVNARRGRRHSAPIAWKGEAANTSRQVARLVGKRLGLGISPCVPKKLTPCGTERPS